MTDVLSVRLPQDVKKRLDALRKATGRPVTFYVREAVVSYMDELEYIYTLEEEAARVRKGQLPSYSLDALESELFGGMRELED